MSEDSYYSASVLAGLPGVPGTERRVRSRADRNGWERRKKLKGKGWEYAFSSLPAETQASLLQRESQAQDQTRNHKVKQATDVAYDPADLWAHFDGKPQAQKDRAKERLNAILSALALIENGMPKTAAWAAVAKANGYSKSTLYGWYNGRNGTPGAKHYDRADWLAALVPGYTGRTATTEFSDDAWEFFTADYLRLEQPGAAACYQRLIRAAEKHGWQIPSLRTIERRIEREIPRTMLVLLREGESALVQMFPAQQRSVRDIHALQWINGDGYQHNVFVKWPDGTIARPKTWFWQDIYSRKYLSYRTDQTENTDMLRLSFGDLVEKFGIPEHATIDNTRAAANKWMTGGVPNRYRFKVKEDDPLGIMPMLGVQVHWTSVIAGKGHGQAKPVERSFGVGGMGEYVDKHPAFAGAFTGDNPMAKPANYGETAVPLDKFLQVLAEEVAAWNAREGRRTEICDGKLSFDQAFAASYEHSTIRKATAEQRRLWLMAAEAIRVASDGSVTLDAGRAHGMGKNRYHADALYEFAGKKIVVRFDPQALHDTIHAYTLDGRYIAECQCITATGFGDTEAAREHNRARREMVKATKIAAKAEQKMDAIEVAGKLPEPDAAEIPTAKVVRTLTPALHRHKTPQKRPLTANEKKTLDRLKAEQTAQATVHELPQGMVQRDRYWVSLRERVEAGETLEGRDAKFYDGYQKTANFRGFRIAEEDLASHEAGK